MLLERLPPRLRLREVWRIDEAELESAQDAATLMATQDQIEAGIDIATDGEVRRESYVNRFATALEGVDIDLPGQVYGRDGTLQFVPRVVAPIRRGRAGPCPLRYAGLVQFSKSAAAEWAPHGVRVVALAPGRTLTPMTAPFLATEEQRREGLKHIPAGRYGRPEEMAKLALFLASDAASYVVGATLVADGGYVLL